MYFWYCTSTAPQRPTQGTVSFQVATHRGTEKVCHALGGRFRTWDCHFIGSATIEQPHLLKRKNIIFRTKYRPLINLLTEVTQYFSVDCHRHSRAVLLLLIFL